MILKSVNKKQLDEVSESVSKSEENKQLSNDVLVIAQEIKIIKSLVSNDLPQRTKQLKKLRRWLSLRANSSFPFAEADFLRIWKGLYYMMWMSDKPLVQEELAEDLGKLINCFTDVKSGVQFFGAFLKTMCREWFGIDQWRMDKFLMLIRRIMRYMFDALKRDNWSVMGIKEFNNHIFETVLAENTSSGITMHFMDVFFEELAKVSEGELAPKTVCLFIKPFVKFMAHQHDLKILGYCRNRIFHHLLYQSELGREYLEKYNAWKEMGFPTESINDIEKNEEEDGDLLESDVEGPKVMDPRAGNVDVYIPLLQFDAKYIIKEIESLIYKEETSTKCRKLLKDVLEKYQIYESGKFPLGIQKMPKLNLKSEKPLMKSKVEALENLEHNLYSTTRKLKQFNKRKRRKFLASLNFDEADVDTFEQVIESKLSDLSNNAGKARKRKSVSSMAWVEEEGDVSPSKIKKPEEVPSENAETSETVKLKKKKNVEDSAKDQVNKVTSANENEWNKPIEEGEIEYFIPSRKIKLKNANEKLSDIVPNPFSKINQSTVKNVPNSKQVLLGKKISKCPQPQNNISQKSQHTPKRVKIVLQRNTVQKPSEYIKQIKSSPHVPYDAKKKPTKGLLKPNTMPSPINPFYRKKIGLKINETA